MCNLRVGVGVERSFLMNDERVKKAMAFGLWNTAGNGICACIY